MKTDSIFFEIFQTMPQCLFEILGEPPEKGNNYEFTSVEVKQTAFRIDGVFLPKADAPDNTVIFVEFQSQRDEVFYERFASEVMLYLKLNRSFDDWRAVVVYPRRSIEQSRYECHRFFVESRHFQRLYLEDFLGQSSDAIGIQLMQLIVSPKKETPQYLEGLVEQLEDRTTPNRQGIIDLAVTIMVYKFENLTREEIESMFTVNDLKQTRFYQDVLEEGIEQGIEQGRKEGKEEGREEGREEGLTEGMRLALAESLQREKALLTKQLTRKFGELSPTLIESVGGLIFEELDLLGEKLFDFEQMSDLEAWLQQLILDRSPKEAEE